MKILISGATGFLGKHLIEYFSQQKENQILGITSKYILTYSINPQFQFVNWNLLGQPDHRAKKTIENFDADLVIHAAAISSNKDCQDNWWKNGLMTQNLLNNLHNRQKFVYISSADVYDSTELILGAHINSATNPVNAYGLSKLISEKLCMQAITNNKLAQCLIIRPTAFTGKGATHGLVKDVVTKLISNSPTLKLLGKHPGSIKPIIHVNDLIKYLDRVINHPYKYWMVNISNDSQSVYNIALSIMEELKIHKLIEWSDENFPNDINEVHVNSSTFVGINSTLQAVKLAAKGIYEEMRIK